MNEDNIPWHWVLLIRFVYGYPEILHLIWKLKINKIPINRKQNKKPMKRHNSNQLGNFQSNILTLRFAYCYCIIVFSVRISAKASTETCVQCVSVSLSILNIFELMECQSVYFNELILWLVLVLSFSPEFRSSKVPSFCERAIRYSDLNIVKESTFRRKWEYGKLRIIA